MQSDDAAGGLNQSVGKAFGVLRAFEGGSARLRVSDVARICGLGTSTASRLLATLEAAGMLERIGDGAYQLGREVIALAGIALNGSSLFREARPVAYELSCATELGVNVAELDGDRLFYLLHFDGRLAPRSHTLMGQRNLLYCTGLGKAIIAFAPPEQQRQLIETMEFVAHTAHTITTAEAYSRELELVRAKGYAVEREELAFGRSCVAAPILGRNREPIGAISISGPQSALDLSGREPALAQMVIEAADRIGIALQALPDHLSSQTG